VAGKTGTAQKPIPGGYSDDRNIASFLGVLPADRPEIGIIVVLDEPKPARTGGLVAAPVFAAIAQQAVRHLGIAPDGPPRVIDPTIESPGSPPLGEPL
jgi:cell division protein FtsI (penicillin-binding protein 3)